MLSSFRRVASGLVENGVGFLVAEYNTLCGNGNGGVHGCWPISNKQSSLDKRDEQVCFSSLL